MVSVFLKGLIGVGKTWVTDNLIKYLNDENNYREIEKKYPNLLKFHKKTECLLEAPDSKTLTRYYNAFNKIKGKNYNLFMIILGLFFAFLILGYKGRDLILLFPICAYVVVNVYNKWKNKNKLYPKDVCFDTQIYFLTKNI